MSVASVQGIPWRSVRAARILDRIAGKAVMLTVAWIFLWSGNITWWELILVATRDIVVALIYLAVAVRKYSGEFETSPLVIGKLATCGQLVYLLTVLVYPPAYTLVLLVAAALSIAAAGGYLYDSLIQVRTLRAS